MIIKILAFLDLFAVSLVVPALGSHFLNSNIIWIGSIYGIAQFFSQPYFGRLADRIGIKNTILLSLSISSFSYFIISVTDNVYYIILSRMLCGMFKQTQELSRLYLVSNTPIDERTKTIGLFNSIGSAGFIIGPTIGGHIREMYETSGFYFCAKITSFIFILNCFLVLIFMENDKCSQKSSAKIRVTNNNENKKSIFAVLQMMWDLCLIRLFLTMGILTARFVVPILTERAFGPAKSGYVISFTALAGTISASIASILIPKLLTVSSVAMTEFYAILGCFSSLLLIALSWAQSPNWFLFLSYLALNCLFTQASRILLTELTVQRCPPSIRGYALGTVTSLTSVSRALCDVKIAFLLQFHDLMPLYSGAALTLFAAVLTITYSTKKLKLE